MFENMKISVVIPAYNEELLIGKVIEHQFGTSLSLASVSRVMKLLGFSAQKPLYQAWQQDPVLVRRWESETYPEIRAEARRAGARIHALGIGSASQDRFLAQLGSQSLTLGPGSFAERPALRGVLVVALLSAPAAVFALENTMSNTPISTAPCTRPGGPS